MTEAAVTAEAIERETDRIAKEQGCDRGTFTVCWAEYERGDKCRCKEEARALLASLEEPNANLEERG